MPYTREMSFPPVLETIPEMNKSAIEETTVQTEIISSDELQIDGEDGNVIPALEEMEAERAME